MDSPALDVQSERARAAFQSHYGYSPRWLASAPGRVNLIGEFTDFNDGFVLPMALEERTTIAAAPNGTSNIAVYSEQAHGATIIDARQIPSPDAKGEWSNYVKGLVAGFIAAGLKLYGVDVYITSTLPVGAGLSSSAALEVAFATLLEAVCGRAFDPIIKALLCQKAEHDFAQVPCGIMDQYVATFGRAGHALLLDCRANEALLLPFDDPTISVLVVNSNVRHALAHSEYPKRREDCMAAARALGLSKLRDASLVQLQAQAFSMNPVVLRRARHIINETARTQRAAECLKTRDWRGFGRLLDASHKSLQHDYEASCFELDVIVSIAQSIGVAGGVFGSRMTGGGFGGCAIALVRTNLCGAVIEEIDHGYRARTGKTATFLVAQPGEGARIIDWPS